MGRIIFINPFASTRISGGIKSTYQHAELLTELGYRLSCSSPPGRRPGAARICARSCPTPQGACPSVRPHSSIA